MNNICNVFDVLNPYFLGSIQLSSNQKNNSNGTTASFTTTISNGIRGKTILLDSIIFVNDITTINIWNYTYILNGVQHVLNIGYYSDMFSLLSMISTSVSNAAGHLISFSYANNGDVIAVGSAGFTDNIIFDISIDRMLGFTDNSTIVLVNLIPIYSLFSVPSIPIYTQWVNVGVNGTHSDQSYSYGKGSYPLLCCIPIGNFGERINHREVQFRVLKMTNFISTINVQVFDEYGRLAPLGGNSLTINFFYY